MVSFRVACPPFVREKEEKRQRATLRTLARGSSRRLGEKNPLAQDTSNEKQQAHQLIDRLAPSQVSAVVGLLEALLDPVSRAIANAPVDDEPETEQERQAIAASKAWFQQRGGQGIPHDDVLAEFGLKPGDFKDSKDRA